jgi:hypothetical protein
MSNASRIEYSEKYADDANEYRYVGNVVVVDGKQKKILQFLP